MDDSTVSEILDVFCHISDAQIGNMLEQLDGVTEWATDQDIILNKEKCKEIIVDFRNTKTEIPHLQVGQPLMVWGINC